MRYKVIFTHAEWDSKLITQMAATCDRIEDHQLTSEELEYGSYVCVSEKHPLFNFDIWSDMDDELYRQGPPSYMMDDSLAPILTRMLKKYLPSIYNYWLHY